MASRRGVGIGLAVVGVVLIAGSGMIWSRGTRELKPLAETRAVLEDSLGVLRAEYRRTSTRSMAFRQSMPSMPDSVRRYGGKKLMEISSGYTKQLRTLKTKERDINLRISGTRLRADAIKRRAVSSSTPVAVAGLVTLVAGLVAARTARSRRVGA